MATDPVEILNRRNAEVAKIRGYSDLTEEAKERRIAEVSERARAEYAEARKAAEREIRERVEKAEKALFETPYPVAADDLEKAQIRALRRAPTMASTTACTSSGRRKPARNWIGC